jgi:hypothetical protein
VGSPEATLPLGRRLIACAVVGIWALATGVSAQPAEFFACPGRGPTDYSCAQLRGGSTILAPCPTDPGIAFYNFIGPLAWYPLRCVGPITVALQTFSPANTWFPVYVEVVPVQDSGDLPWVCENLPGTVISIVYGQSVISAPGGTWDEAGPIDITRFVPLGSLYAIRLYLFSNIFGTSPFLGCIRVTAHPVESAPVASRAWGDVKALYR